MKKNSLTTAVVAGVAGIAGLAGVANAVNINPDGLGQVLIYPYYTVNGGSFTALSVVNTTDEVKAVKVRFLEAKNSREVLDFNLYLSPFDVWTAAVSSSTADTSGPAVLTTADTSCTVPAIPAGGVEFRNFAYTGAFNDDAENDLARTREGHVEMIEMGVVDETVSAAATGFEAAAIHTAAGVPLNCASLRASWAGGTWDNDRTVDVRGPTGGLFGLGAMIDVSNGTALSYNADAIDGFYQLNNANLHFRPGTTQPSLAQAQTSAGEADAIVFNNGNLVTLDFASGTPDAVSAVFMHDTLYNEYNTDPALNAASEWVMTFPTKRLHLESGANVLPFANDANNSGDANLFDESGYCEPISVRFFDREEQEPGTAPEDIDFSPEPPISAPPGTNLCWEANVITFNQAATVAGGSAVLGSRNAFNVQLTDIDGSLFTEGWIRMGVGDSDNYLLDNPGAAAGTPRNQIFGLPVTGFWAANFENAAAAPGTLANYSVISKHRASFTGRTVTVAADGTITDTGFAAS